MCLLLDLLNHKHKLLITTAVDSSIFFFKLDL